MLPDTSYQVPDHEVDIPNLVRLVDPNRDALSFDSPSSRTPDSTSRESDSEYAEVDS